MEQKFNMGLLSNIYAGITMLFFSLLGAPMHEFHVSNCQIDHNTNTHSLEITLKIYTDDFEAAIKQEGGVMVDLLAQSEDEIVNGYVKQYLLKNFLVELNGKEIVPQYIGIEPEDQTIRCYLEIPDTENIESFKLQNQVLMDLFSEQQNIVYINIAQKKHSLLFDIDSDIQELSL